MEAISSHSTAKIMPSDKPRIQIRFEGEDFEYLEQWAKSEFIPTTQLCKAIILRAIANRKENKESK